MKDKVKVTITREDGSPICVLTPEPDTVFLTDDAPVLLIRKTGGTVEMFSGDMHSAAALLQEMAE